MLNAQSANKIALQVLVEPIESKILTAVNLGKFLVIVRDLHEEARKYFEGLGYSIKLGSIGDAWVISWYTDEIKL